jgi:hypothetical protein
MIGWHLASGPLIAAPPKRKKPRRQFATDRHGPFSSQEFPLASPSPISIAADWQSADDHGMKFRRSLLHWSKKNHYVKRRSINSFKKQNVKQRINSRESTENRRSDRGQSFLSGGFQPEKTILCFPGQLQLGPLPDPVHLLDLKEDSWMVRKAFAPLAPNERRRSCQNNTKINSAKLQRNCQRNQPLSVKAATGNTITKKPKKRKGAAAADLSGNWSRKASAPDLRRKTAVSRFAQP